VAVIGEDVLIYDTDVALAFAIRDRSFNEEAVKMYESRSELVWTVKRV
jgi:hypothetical protein